MAQDDLEERMGKVIRIEVKPRHHGESVEKMIKRFAKKMKKEKVIEEVLERKYYEKPSVKRRKKAKKRKKILEKLNKENRENLDDRRGKDGR